MRRGSTTGSVSGAAGAGGGGTAVPGAAGVLRPPRTNQAPAPAAASPTRRRTRTAGLAGRTARRLVACDLRPILSHAPALEDMVEPAGLDAGDLLHLAVRPAHLGLPDLPRGAQAEV